MSNSPIAESPPAMAPAPDGTGRTGPSASILLAAMIGAGTGAALWPLYGALSPWIGVGIGIGVYAIVATALLAPVAPPLPLIAVLLADIQLILAAWLAHFYPYDEAFGYNIKDLPAYLTYAGPVVLVAAVAASVPLLFLPVQDGVDPESRPTAELDRELEIVFWCGAIFQLKVIPLPGALQFVGVLVGNLAYVAAFAQFLLRSPRGTRNLAIAFGFLGLRSMSAGFFHALLIWMAMLGLIIAYRQRMRWRLVPILVGGILLAFALQQIKGSYRLAMEEQRPQGIEAKLRLFGAQTASLLNNPGSLFDRESLAATALRFNQGWIVNRVLIWVPLMEPYCGTEMLKRQLSSLVPRAFQADKYRVGGHEFFTRFTGRSLEQASMGLGYAGEMYAAFGKQGGWIGVGVYALCIGGIFLAFGHLAQRSQLWWAWAPFVMAQTIKAEDTVGNVMNWTVKALVVMGGVLFLCPAFRQALGLGAGTRDPGCEMQDAG